jgi:Holliday junction DNA helicase RuvA
MIGKLRGFIDSLQEDKCIIDVAGVGYNVFLSHKTAQFLKQFPEKKELSLIIETIVKEDAIELYGFAKEIEKTWFSELTKVQGVGAKMALKILGFFEIDQLVKALISSDVNSLTKISGIGPKLAQRIATELKDSPKKLGIDTQFLANKSDSAISYASSAIADDAVSALENLGYKKSDSLRIISLLLKQNSEITLENLITSSLRELSKNKF